MTEPNHFSMTRRHFLATSARAVAASALPTAVSAQNARFRRWEISDPAMPSRILDSYKKGIREMLNRPPSDPRNWYRTALIHVFDCPHGNWWFLPWHRAYIGWLEQTIRAFSGDMEFALPYWDWTKTPRIPSAMFEDVLDPNNAAFIASFATFKARFDAPVHALWDTFSEAQKAVLAQRGLSGPADFWSMTTPPDGTFYEQPNARGLHATNPNLDPTTQAAVKAIRSALLTPSFAGSATGPDPAGFASARQANHSIGSENRKGILESQPHDNVHGAIGGRTGRAFMVDFLSPLDPIFYLHHANLDRLWDVWTRRQTALGRPALPQGADLTTWSDEQFLCFSDAGGQSVSRTNAGAYATTTVFDYDYSPGSGENLILAPGAVIAALPQTRRFNANIAAATVRSGKPAGGVAQVPAAALAAAAPQAPGNVVEVTMEFGPADRGRRFQVRVARGPGSAAIVAGGITVIGHAHGATTFTLPLPENLAGSQGGGNVPLDISVQPLEPASGTSPGARVRSTLRAARSDLAPPARVTAIAVRAN
jgi:tyrosinase